uniref:Uncharacterized protein n=1 Tax=Tanacetum cinerariifolium TaxID=118510 RepID=A0A6L2M1B8_TANCI|nr:hypothetical protein [Tanacetum cinerariifolium]
MSKAKERCMAYFRSLHAHLQVLSKEDLKGTRKEHGFIRAFMSLFGQDNETFTILEFETPVIEKNVKESLEDAVLAKSLSQPKSTYEAAASLFEFELTKILIDKMEEYKSYLRADYKRELYNALVKSYNTDKDLFDTYGEVFVLKRSQDDKDKDQDPSVGSDR